MENASGLIGRLVAGCDVTGGMWVEVRDGFADCSCLSYCDGPLDAPRFLPGGSVVESCVEGRLVQSFAFRGQ